MPFKNNTSNQQAGIDRGWITRVTKDAIQPIKDHLVGQPHIADLAVGICASFRSKFAQGDRVIATGESIIQFMRLPLQIGCFALAH